ncbi:MAG: hypothetical protein GWM90_12930 [Gemmatimonadetes bacterium]|nr:hypothetical protein [Gemmatimonadota bacterium]NIQ60355.1 hypothetical protein [Gemmatimonadota bacterium]NIU73388.1 hypothetical protein [Gammaproteobacteria bacterium]NIX44982.1 hypothetical protein [Gemmatimonadota bacterium]NIY07809.1 hypothetical protein [Gemmatimonadota bacterium]
MTRIIAALAALPLVATALPASAQDPGDHTPADHGAMATAEGMPDGWRMRFDRSGAGPDMVDFRVMEPGWHMTTGRAGAGIYWQPDMTAAGEYSVRTTIHLFDPASHAEAFGLFIGGTALDAEDQSYVYFLVRQTGEYLVKRRAGAETANVVGWTGHEAVPEATPGEEGSTQYDLEVRVGGDAVDFLVQGEVVHSLPRSEVATEGIVGLRINHMLDVHVQELELEQAG